MDFTPREEEIYSKMIDSSKKFLINFDFNELNTDALTLSLDLDIDRSNVSRILNKLHRDNYLIKVQGRPTLFLARNVILEKSTSSYVSSLITDKDSFIESINDDLQLKHTFHPEILKDALIGFNDNESMYDQSYVISTMINYPNHLYNIDILGSPSTGKDAVIKYIHETGCNLNRYYSELYEFNALQYSGSFEDVVTLLNKISSINNPQSTTLIVIKQTYRLNPSILTYLMSQIRLIQSDPNQTPKQFIFVEDDIGNETQRKLIGPYVTNSLTIPNVDDRTIKEKVEFILSFFQEEAKAISRPIYLSKNIFSCFAMTTYEHNLKEIENEVRYAVSKAMFHHKGSSKSVLDMEFDDLSDTLLNNIQNVTNRLNELEKIFDFVNQSDFYFIPHIASKELFSLRNSVLDYNSNIIDSSLSLSPLSSYVKKEIELSMNTELNTIRTLNVKNIYNTIYPLFTKEFSYPDRVLYLLFMHLESIIHDIKKHTYKQEYYIDYDYQRPEIVALSQKIATTIENEYQITLPGIELSYIQSYLTHARFNSSTGNIPILLVSHSLEIADSYKNYIDSLNIKVEIQTSQYQPQVLKDHMNIFIASLRKQVSSLNQGRGVVIITDVTSISTIMQEVFHDSNHEVVVIPSLSLDSLIKASTLAEIVESKIEDFQTLNATIHFSRSNILIGENEADITSNFIHDASIKLLSESLVFLDVQKSTALLSSVLMNIYKSLDFEYSDSLSIRFIHHSSFMIERIIRNEALTYKHVNNFIKKFPNIYTVVEENFQIINNQFGITVPASELVMISEIFVSVISY